GWACGEPGLGGDARVPAPAAAGTPLAAAALGPVHRPVHGRAVHRDRRLGRVPGAAPGPGAGRVGPLADRRWAGPRRHRGPVARAAGGAAVRDLAGPGVLRRPGAAVPAGLPAARGRAGPGPTRPR